MDPVIKRKQHTIYHILPGSIAEELDLEAGDILLSINGQEIKDIFDYHYLTSDEQLVLLVLKQNGEEWELEIEKDESEDLGITFENGLMDDYKSCSNKCIFCFIDQMPPGMRDTLYFKDDDSRLSFLQGNYVTLTNMKEQDVRRIIQYRLAPINISVHTTNPQLRCTMLQNRFAGEALKKIERFYEAGIEMNGQIVLCKGINDGAELERTIRDLTSYIPNMESLSVVPVGLTRYREGLYPLEPFEEEDAKRVIAIIEKWQAYCMERFGIHFVHASDEWYLTAGLPLPEEERYDGYLQLENGVGMVRLLVNEFEEAMNRWTAPEKKAQIRSRTGLGNAAGRQRVTLATGFLMKPFLQEMSEQCMKEFPEYEIIVRAIRNDFFGERITVSGLITAQDLAAQLKGTDIGQRLLLPGNMLRSGEQVFLDDWTVAQLEKALQVRIDIVKSSGQDLLFSLLGI